MSKTSPITSFPPTSYVKIYSNGNKLNILYYFSAEIIISCRVGRLTVCQAESLWGDFINKNSL